MSKVNTTSGVFPSINSVCAIDFIKSLEDIGVDHDEIKASAEYDPKLEEAINTVFEEDEESDGYGEDD